MTLGDLAAWLQELWEWFCRQPVEVKVAICAFELAWLIQVIVLIDLFSG